MLVVYKTIELHISCEEIIIPEDWDNLIKIAF